MTTRRADQVLLAGLLTAAIGLAASAPVSASSSRSKFSEYKAPAAGKWKVYVALERASGSATVTKGGKTFRGLKVTGGAQQPNLCTGGGGTVVNSIAMVGAAKIKRLGLSQRPAVGRKLSRNAAISAVPARFKVNGKTTAGRLLFLSEKDGREASVTATIGKCEVFVNMVKAR